ncbi:MAG TPA: alpha/beta hydrolase [Bacilli bacterium]
MPIAHVNGADLHFHRSGSGTPLVFIHPPLLTSANFHYQTAQLSDAFTVITFDIRGHGFSHATETALTYPLIAEDMKQLLDFIGMEKAIVCGYSAGATIAMEAMLAYPDKFVAGIFLSGMPECSDFMNRSRLQLAVAACNLRAKKMIASAICYGNADTRYTFTTLYNSAIHGDVGHWGQYYAQSLSYSCKRRLAGIKQPVLLIYGKKNKSFYRYANMLRKSLPRNELYLVDGVSHQLPTKAALHINEIIRGWAKRTFSAAENDLPFAAEPHIAREIEKVENLLHE